MSHASLFGSNVSLSGKSHLDSGKSMKASTESLAEESFVSTLSRRFSRSIAKLNNEEIVPELLTPRPDPVENWEKWAATNRVSPESRENSVGVIYNDYLFVFGGCGGSRGKERTDFVFRRYLKNQSCMWEKVKCTGFTPPPSSAGTGTLVKNEMWVYGGEDQFNTRKKKGKKREVHGTMFALDLDHFTWRGVKTTGSLSTNSLNPMPKRGHTTNFVSASHFKKGRIFSPTAQNNIGEPTKQPRMRDILLAFGGCGPDDSFLMDRYNNDLYILDIEKEKWHLARTEGESPSPRSMHTTTLVPKKGLYVFGGITAHVESKRDGPNLDKTFHNVVRHPVAESDVYLLQVATKKRAYTWSKLRTTGKPPPPRYGHSAVLNMNNDLEKPRYIYYFGGRLASSREPQNCVYLLDIRSQPQSWLSAKTSGLAPSARFLHIAMLWNKSTMVVYGGSNYKTYTNGDLYFLEMSDQTRTEKMLEERSRKLSSDAMSVAQLTDDFAFDSDEEDAIGLDDSVLALSGKSSLGTISMLRTHSPDRKWQHQTILHSPKTKGKHRSDSASVTFKLGKNAVLQASSRSNRIRPATAGESRRRSPSPSRSESRLNFPVFERLRKSHMDVSFPNNERLSEDVLRSRLRRAQSASALSVKLKMIRPRSGRDLIRALEATHRAAEEERIIAAFKQRSGKDEPATPQSNHYKRRLYTGMYKTPKPVKIKPPPRPKSAVLKRERWMEKKKREHHQNHVRGFVPIPIPQRAARKQNRRPKTAIGSPKLLKRQHSSPKRVRPQTANPRLRNDKPALSERSTSPKPFFSGGRRNTLFSNLRSSSNTHASNISLEPSASLRK